MRITVAVIILATGIVLPRAESARPPIAIRTAPSAETPERFVRRVYAMYRHGGPGISTERPGGVPFYSAALLDAFAKESEAAHGEVGAIDSDPLCGCQDYDNLRVTNVSIAGRSADAVDARVTFVDLKQRRAVTLILARTGTGWRIADVSGANMKSLMALLQDSIDHPAVEPAAPGSNPSSPKP